MLEAIFTTKFERDVKALVKKRYNINLLREVINLAIEDTEKSVDIISVGGRLHAAK